MIDYDNISDEDYIKIVILRAGFTAMIIQELYNTDWYTAFHKLIYLEYISSTHQHCDMVLEDFSVLASCQHHERIRDKYSSRKGILSEQQGLQNCNEVLSIHGESETQQSSSSCYSPQRTAAGKGF